MLLFLIIIMRFKLQADNLKYNLKKGESCHQTALIYESEIKAVNHFNFNLNNAYSLNRLQ